MSGGSLFTKRQIVLLTPASGATRRVTLPDGLVWHDISPDGRRIAFTGISGMWVMDRDGSHARRIFRGGGELAWSPDSRRLVFVATDANESLFTIAADGTDLKRIIDRADQPDWTPDGDAIVFVRDPEQSSRAGIISLVGDDGRGLRRVVDSGRWKNPRVSPDGATVAFDDGKDIYLSSIDDGEPRLFARDGRFPTWSPDGRHIAFTRDVSCPSGHGVCTGRVFVIPASGGKARAYGPRIGDIGPLSWTR